MDGLEEVLDSMDELHRLRNTAQEQRASGIRALLEQWRRAGAGHPDDRWDAANDPVEWALVLRTFQLARRQRLLTPTERTQLGAAVAEIVDGAARMCLAGTQFHEDAAQPIPVLTSARLLQALAAIPSQMFSPLGVSCYSRIVRELYTIYPPDWMLGAARAGTKGVASAFATNECVRAVLAVARSLKDTAKLAELLGYFADRMRTIRDEAFERFQLQDWARQERFRAALALHVAATSIGLRTFVAIDALDVPAASDAAVIAWADELGTQVAAQLAGELPEIEKRIAAHIAEFGAVRPITSDLAPVPGTLLGHLQNESLPALPRADESYVGATASPEQSGNRALRRERAEVHEVYPTVEDRVMRALTGGDDAGDDDQPATRSGAR